MLPLNVKKNFCFFLPRNTTTFISLLRLSSSTSAIKTPSSRPNPILEFLTVSCGLSPQRAVTASKIISTSTSIHQAQSVRHFFEHLGFSDSSIRKLIYIYPSILSADADKTLQPNLSSLRSMGFTEVELQLLITCQPFVLITPLAIPRIEFWRTFLGISNKKDLVSVFVRNRGLITQDIASGITPKITLLKKHGISEADIVVIVKRGHSIMSRSLKSIETLLKRAKELGFNSDSSLPKGLSCLCHIGGCMFKEKMEFFKGFGWSEEEIFAALKKAPSFINLSKGKISEKMKFLVGKARCEQSYIASNPMLLVYSLENRMKPRYCVMEILKSREIIVRMALNSIMCLPEKKFVDRYILRYKKQVPEIHEIYIAACAGQRSV